MIMLMKRILLILAMAACLQANAQSLADVVKSMKDKKEAADSTSSSDKGMKPYDKVITDEAETSRGLMDIHKVKSDYYLEIPYSLMGKPMLLSSKVSATSDNSDVIAGQMPQDPLMLEWSCDESKVYLLDASVRAKCDSTEAIARGFALNYMKPVFKAFPIKTISPDSSSVVIDVTKFFCADENYMSPFIPASIFDGLFGINRLKGTFKSDMSSIQSFKAFPENIIFKTRMVYTVTSEPFTAIVTVSMIRLPDEPMRPRLSDHRIGYFTNRYVSYSENKDRSETVSYINRWNLSPKPEDIEKFRSGELVEPEKPIVYYIDDAFPEKWRPYIKEGVEDWQMAFEKIGFKNAIVARDYPDDPSFDPDDIRYSCVRYASTRIANAMGPSWTDPRSGEIIQGSVYFYHDVLKLLHNWRFIQTSTVDPKAREQVYDMEVMGPLLRYLIVHEIGHTLGLMHNMRGSYAYPVDSLRSPSFTAKYGTTASVMDYARYNYVAQPGDGVEWLLPPRLGPYDYFAIRWGYEPILDADTPEEEKPVLNGWIREKDGDPMYMYGEQEIFSLVDPASQTESLGDDAMKASSYGIKNLKVIMDNLVGWTAEKDKDYKYTQEMYNEVLKQFNRYMGHCTKYIGGNFLQYPVYGDGKPAYVAVPRKKQKEALEFVYANVYELSEWMMDNDLLKLFDPGNSVIYDYQASYVRTLMSQYARVGYTAKTSADPYTQYEYLNDLYRLVFRKTLAGKRLTRTDMNMEYAFVYTLFENLDLLEGGTAKKIADLESLVPEETLPCAWMEYREQADGTSLAKARRESDIKISGKEIYFGILSDLQKVLEKRAGSGPGEQAAHYSYLSYEVSKALGRL